MKTIKWICYVLTALCSVGIVVCVARPVTPTNRTVSLILMLACMAFLAAGLLVSYFAVEKKKRADEFWRLGAAIGLGVMLLLRVFRLL